MGDVAVLVRDGRVQDLAVDVELELVDRFVADTDGGRALVAGEVVEVELGEAPFSFDAVHDLHLGWVPPYGAPPPAHPRRRLLGVPGDQQGLQGEGRVAEPGVAVVPVPVAPDGLGE